MSRAIYVAKSGDNSNDGSSATPLLTIQAAAAAARPGDTITVREGVYRERIDPPRGGRSDAARIVFQAAPGERVVIKGSEPARGWTREEGDLWKLTLPNSFFGAFNPFAEKLRGHWFIDNDRDHHPGSVYVNGHWLLEAESLSALRDEGSDEPRWVGMVDDAQTTLWAEFRGFDPNTGNVEVSARQSVFYPSQTGVNYLTVRGFELLHAATPWAPPTTEQIGLIGTNWGKGWIIEDNHIAYSACAGLTLGKYDDPEDFGDRELVEFTTGEDTFHGTIRRALAYGWSLDSTGHHVVRGNEVSHCEMAGICGSLGAVKSVIEHNHVHDIYTRRLFNGHEQAGIKFHAPIDSLIRHNRVHDCPKAFWMDWMTQGTRLSGNLCYRNGPDMDLYLEVNHGPCVVDNNLFLSEWSINNLSEGTLFAHNLVAGKFTRDTVLNRTTPYHEPHSTAVMGFTEIRGGDDRLFHNLFVDPGALDAYRENTAYPCTLQGNQSAGVAIEVVDEELRLSAVAGRDIGDGGIVRTQSLGTAMITQLPFLDYDGADLVIDHDMNDAPRHPNAPTPGPFEAARNGDIRFAFRTISAAGRRDV